MGQIVEHTKRADKAKKASLETQAPVDVFQGYDSVTGAGLSTALIGKTKNVGATSNVSYRVCTDLEKLSEALEIDQSLSVGFGPIGNIDQKMKFVHNLDVTTYSVSIVVYSRHALGSRVMTDVALKDGLQPPRSNDEMRQFFRGYGDSFLSSVSEGGEYYAVYTYYSQTREEQTDLTADMKAHGIFDGGSVDASLQTKISSFNSSTSTRISFDQNMSGMLNPAFPPSNDIISFALSFPAKELTAPAIIGYETIGYERVPGFGDFQPIAKNREFFVGNTVVGGLTKPLVSIQTLQNQITWLQAIYLFYGGFNDAKLSETTALAKTDHDKINEMLQKYEADPTGSFAAPNLPSLDNGTPQLEYEILHSPQYGGSGGGPFDDVNVDTSIPQQTRVSALQLRTGSNVDKLLVTYTSTTGTWTVEHGGNGGGLSNKLSLRQGIFVVKTGGRSGAIVDHLTLAASNGEAVDGGGGGGGPFVWNVPDGSFLLGFAGRSGSSLDAIQFVYGGFKPASWTPIPQ